MGAILPLSEPLQRVNPLLWKLKVFATRVAVSSEILVRAPSIFRNWTFFLTSRFSGGTGILELRNGLRMKFRKQSTDRSTISEVHVLGAYADDDLFKLAETDTVLDVGANIGAFTVLAARCCPNGRVVAVEPLGSNAGILLENVELNGFKNVTIHQLALDSSNGERVLHFGTQCPSLHWSSEGAQGERVQTKTLARFFIDAGIDRVDLLKMDCEGAEFDILLNTDAATLGRIRRIVMEYHNIDDRKNDQVLAAHLRKAGFDVTSRGSAWNGELRAVRRR